MALTKLQRVICRLIARNRIDLFHDTEEALQASWVSDRRLLEEHGFRVRPVIDVIESHDRIQPLGFLAWAACGKDPGFNPASILEHAARSGRYSRGEDSLLFHAGRIRGALPRLIESGGRA